MSLEDIVKHFKMTDLSGEEIQTLIGKAPVLYSDLAKYKSMTQLLGKENYVVILYQTSSKTTGHFVAITRNDTTGLLRYFDSYSLTPDTELQFTAFDRPLPKYIIGLLGNENYEVNKVDYQAKKSGISTCGRYASTACMFRNISLKRIEELYKMNKSSWLNEPDNAVTVLTLLGLKDISSYLDAIPRGRGL